MKFNFYKVNSESIEALDSHIMNYSNITQAILKSNSMDKITLIKEKNSIQQNILNILSKEQLLGSLYEEEYDLLPKTFRNKHLNKNILTKENIEDMYIDIDEICGQTSNKLKQIIKKALMDNSVICFWIV